MTWERERHLPEKRRERRFYSLGDGGKSAVSIRAVRSTSAPSMQREKVRLMIRRRDGGFIIR